MSAKPWHFDRRFLNGDGFGTSAHAICSVSLTKADKKKPASVEAYVRIADCFDSVELCLRDAGVATPKARTELQRNNIAKLRTLIDMLEAMSGALDSAYRELSEHRR